MKLIEILTTPYAMSCDCAACFTGTYQKMTESVQGCYESEAISVLADQQLSHLLKMGKANADRHSTNRFAILINLVSDPQRKFTFIKNFVKDDAFDLELLDLFTIREYGRTDNTQREMMDSSWWFQIEKIIKNAYVFRRFPELIENKILPYDTEKLIVYITEIDELGAHHFKMYFSHYYKDDLVVITHMLFDEYLKTNQDFLVPLIQIVYSMLDNAKTPRFRIHHAHSVTELTNKILTKCNHECLPFKTTNFGAQNLDEYMYLLEKNNFVKQNLLDLSSQQNQKTYRIHSTIDGHRKNIQMIEHEIQLLNKQLEHNTQSESRITHLYQLRNLNPLERLQFIIDSEYSIHYYPPFLFEDSFEYIEQLSPESKEKLLNKLKTAKRGTLKKLKLSLSSK